MTNRVAIIGTGMVDNPGISHPDKSFKQLLVESVYKAIRDAKIEATDIKGSSFSYTGECEIGYGGVSATHQRCISARAHSRVHQRIKLCQRTYSVYARMSTHRQQGMRHSIGRRI